jgi:hypothetical protein
MCNYFLDFTNKAQQQKNLFLEQYKKNGHEMTNIIEFILHKTPEIGKYLSGYKYYLARNFQIDKLLITLSYVYDFNINKLLIYDVCWKKRIVIPKPTLHLVHDIKK